MAHGAALARQSIQHESRPCTPVALGLALALPHRRVIALDGDGNLLLNLVSLADVSHRKPANLKIFVLDNEAYESPGGMPTATAHGVDLVQIAKGCGIEKSFAAANLDEFQQRLEQINENQLLLSMRKSKWAPSSARPTERSILSSISISSPPTSRRPKEAGVAPALALAIYREVGLDVQGLRRKGRTTDEEISSLRGDCHLFLLHGVCVAAARSAQVKVLEPIKMGYSGIGIAHDFLKLMEKNRIFEKYGLTSQNIYIGSGSLMNQAILGGSIEFTTSDLPSQIQAALAGVDFKVIGVTINRLDGAIMTRKEIRKPEELKGKRLAISRFA